MADAEDTAGPKVVVLSDAEARVASLLCSPGSPAALQDEQVVGEVEDLIESFTTQEVLQPLRDAARIIDVTDEEPRALVPLAPPPAPAPPVPIAPPAPIAPAAPLAPPRRRRRPALLSQQLQRMSQMWPSQGPSSQRLCASLVRRRERRKAVEAPVVRAPAVLAPERPNILFSGFSRSDLHQLKQSVNCLGGSAVKDLPQNASQTRVVVRCSLREGRAIAGARTMKYLEAVVSGAWVLSPEWVHSSMRAGHWLPEADFEVQGDPSALRGAAFGRQHGHELLAGLRLHFPQAG